MCFSCLPALLAPRGAQARESGACHIACRRMIRQGSRFAMTPALKNVQAVFVYVDQFDFPPRYNIAPPQPIAVVHQLHGARRFTLMRWGFVPGWVKDPREISLLATARAETVSERPAFSAAYRRR